MAEQEKKEKSNFFSNLAEKFKKKTNEPEITKFDDLTKINFEEIWDEIFENVHFIDI